MKISVARRLTRAVAAAAAISAAALVAAGVGTAGTSAALTIQVVPGSLSAEQTGLALASLTNNGPSTLTHVLVRVDFPSAVTVTAPAGCTPASGPVGSVTCSLGKLKAGTSATRAVSFGVPSGAASLQLSASATWDSESVGHGSSFAHGRRDNGKSQLTATSSPVTVFAAGDSTHVGTCATSGSFDAELNGQGTELPSVPATAGSLGLPCTPLALGVEPQPASFPSGFKTEIAVVDLPQLQQPATVLLSFPDENLPGSVDNLYPLREFPNWPDTSVIVTVPQCQGGAIPSGFDSCIASVTPNDPDEDADAGTIALLVQGSGLGDPRYAG
jgi:hypothetical protein